MPSRWPRQLDTIHYHRRLLRSWLFPRGHEAWALRLLGEVAAKRTPLGVESAAAHYRQALILAEERGMRPLQAHCHLGLGTLYAVTGQREQAHVALTAAITLYRAMDMTFWCPQAEAAQGWRCVSISH